MFGTKVVTATYYRSDCENSLYYGTSRNHGLYRSTSCCISQCPVHYTVKFDADIFIQSRVIGSHHLGLSGYASLDISGLIVWYELCTKFGSNICYSHRDRRTYHSDLHLMTSCELTFGFDFWSRGPLCMAVMHLPIKFGADIFIQSRVIDTFPKFKMAAAAILDFQVMRIWPFRRVDSVVFVLCTKFGSNNLLLSLRSTNLSFRLSFDDVSRIYFRFRLLVT